MAVFSGRVLMLHNMGCDRFLDFKWDVSWARYAALYQASSKCKVDFGRLAQPDLEWCAGNATAVVVEYNSIDYDMPLLQINAALQGRLQHLAPDGDVFHQVSQQLYAFSQLVVSASQPYRHLADSCLVGMHIRTKKPVVRQKAAQLSDVLQQFASIARGLARHHPGTIFVAADVDVFEAVQQLLPNRTVWWSNLTRSTQGQHLAVAGNPGSDLSAMVDMHLLASCQHIIVTAGSSFGNMAAGHANVAPVYAVFGGHENPYSNPWFWKALSSEPIFFKLSASERYLLPPAVLDVLRQQHPLYLQHAQGHP